MVIPVRDNSSGLQRLLTSLRGLRIVVVDDGSVVPVERDDFAGTHCDIEVLRHVRSRGRRLLATPALPLAPPILWRSWILTWCHAAVGWKLYSAIFATPRSRWLPRASSVCRKVTICLRVTRRCAPRWTWVSVRPGRTLRAGVVCSKCSDHLPHQGIA
ncbi:glycosyl transferase family 2 [Mycobacterium xenopi 4042]|uniref:Glycosyl transferase family 2 n=1 Tax=Mycobacterium xenopi 4042 TaxID=1299334 RepID=X7YKR9_MYCXE|nr:glycosyl transferase family 2 [Mycobacterium xenopi 4042]